MGKNDLFLMPEGHIVKLHVLDRGSCCQRRSAVRDRQQLLDLLANTGDAPHFRYLIGNAVGGDHQHFR